MGKGAKRNATMATIETRITADGSPRYRVKVRLPGSQPQSRTFPSPQAAASWAEQTEAALREPQQAPLAHRHTLRDLVRRYRRHVLPTVSVGTARWREVHLSWWDDRLGHLPLEALTPAYLVEGRDDLAQSRSPRATRAYLATLEHGLKLAVEEWLWLEASPMARVRKPKEPRGRVRFLTDAERPRLLAACQASSNRHLYPLVVLALTTGARKMELLSLTWPQVDIGRALMTLYETKNGEPRSIPLTRPALEVIRAHAKVVHLHTPLVFPRQDGRRPIDIRYAWYQALRQAEIDRFKFHDLRHSCASYLAMNGASLVEIADVLGHKTLSMVRRYAHLSDQHTRGVLNRVSSAIFS
jgi:integrase